jgi:hypothetical protein
VTWRGRLIAERYGDGITARTPLEGWSMGKSLTATLMGVLIKGGYAEDGKNEGGSTRKMRVGFEARITLL